MTIKKYSDGLKELIHLDELIIECGHFTSDTELNSGYGCTHKDNTDYPGCCYSCACPIAVKADLTSIKPRDKDLYERYKVEFKDQLSAGTSEDDLQPDDYGISWMIKL